MNLGGFDTMRKKTYYSLHREERKVYAKKYYIEKFNEDPKFSQKTYARRLELHPIKPHRIIKHVRKNRIPYESCNTDMFYSEDYEHLYGVTYNISNGEYTRYETDFSCFEEE